MRKFLSFILVVAIIVAAFGAYLYFTTPRQGKGVSFPLTQDERTLLAYVPSSADSFAIIPTAAATYAKLEDNPTSRGPVDEWTSKHSMPRPWMLGGADLVAWKAGGQTSYAVRLDTIRAAILQVYLMIAGDSESSPTYRINAPADPPMSADDVSSIDGLTNGLPPGDILIVQREGGRAAFPPIARPAVSSLAISADHIDVVSVAAFEERDRNDRRGAPGYANPGPGLIQPAPSTASSPADAAPQGNEPSTEQAAAPLPDTEPKLVRGALMSLWFVAAPRAVDDLNRLFGTKVSPLVAGGGQIVLYEIEGGKLLPRPRGLFVLPADDMRRDAVRHLESLAPTDVREALGFHVESAERGNELFVAFDRTSIPQYLKDESVPSAWPANRWALRMDAQRFVPVLEQLDGSVGLRIATPRLYRSARDLDRWIAALREARLIEAADTVHGSTEELRVRISAK